MEAAHKYLVKSFYDRTNKGKRYQEQIAKHNTRAVNIQTMDALLVSHFGSKSTASNVIQAYITTMSRDPINLESLGWMSGQENQEKLLLLGLKPEVTTTVGKAEQVTS